MDKPNEIHENLIPTKLTTILYSINFYTTVINTNIPYNVPSFLTASCFNTSSRYTSSYELITKGYMATHTILF